MAGIVSKSPLLAKLGAKLTGAMDGSRGKPPEIGNARLPGGIEGGIARVTEVKLGEYKDGTNKGQPFFMMMATVVEPTTVKTASGAVVTVKGMTTKIGPEPLCDTPTAGGKRKTFEAHFEFMRNHLLILGLNIDGYTGTAEQRAGAIEAGMAALKGQHPYTRFRTSNLPAQNVAQRSDGKWVLTQDGKVVEGKQWATKEAAVAANKFAGTPEAPKEPNVYEEWNGRVDGYIEAVDPGAGVDDGSGASPTQATSKPNGHLTGKTGSIPTGGGTRNTVTKPAPEPEPAPEQFDEFGDLESLRARAEAGDDDAQSALLGSAEGKGMRAEAEASQDATWAEVVAMIDGTWSGNDAAEEPTEDVPVDSPAAWEPQVEEMYFYHPPAHYDPKTKKLKNGKDKKPLPPAECEVVDVDADAQTADLKDIDTKVTHKAVSWDAFRPAE